jgi:hypothetical protein
MAVFQPVTQCAVEPDMRKPDQRDGEHIGVGGEDVAEDDQQQRAQERTLTVGQLRQLSASLTYSDGRD